MQENIKQISWKKKIKYVQLWALIAFVVLYFIYGWFVEVKQHYDSLSKTFEQKEIKIAKLNETKANIKFFSQKIQDIIKNKQAFIKAYNECYFYYALKDYALSGTKVANSLKDCLYNKWYNKPYIKNFSDQDIIKIALWMGVLKQKNSKEFFPQTQILYSLDKNIFSDDLEQYVDLLSFGLPKLENKQLRLYSVNISFKTKVNYSMFLNLFSNLQNKLYARNNIYYSIQNISKFDVVNNSFQDLLVQAKVYFIK